MAARLGSWVRVQDRHQRGGPMKKLLIGGLAALAATTRTQPIAPTGSAVPDEQRAAGAASAPAGNVPQLGRNRSALPLGRAWPAMKSRCLQYDQGMDGGTVDATVSLRPDCDGWPEIAVKHPRWECPRCGQVMFWFGASSHQSRCTVGDERPISAPANRLFKFKRAVVISLSLACR